MLIEAESAFRVANSPQAAALVNGVISTATLGMGSSFTGFVSYNKHQNANIITGQQEIKGGWGGGVSWNALGKEGGFIKEVLKAQGFNIGASYNRDSGLGVNASLNYTVGSGNKGLGVGGDYNFKDRSYGLNASLDLHKSENGLHHVGVSMSARSDGHADVGAYYNYGNEKIPPQFRGHGGSLTFNDQGNFTASGQMQGATVASITYDTNTHGFKPLELNYNFQNEFNQGLAAENAQKNHERTSMELAYKEVSLGTKMEKPLFTQSEVDTYLPRDKDGNIDMTKAQPEKLMAKWDEYKVHLLCES
ncbi:TIGR04388 family protein [Leptospira sp. FAT2]|uniref:TIGR04388 family protein n=1 Tax=Leptospira sanjuanensis TaxID=2879643 RepID=UPI001EE93C09|nr:TIGR04388 family protein [Leptospira sanjuanensis]MCG6166868.1 TIGR04388 family protein [Leptospira sanjuanensis]MCG6192250.1 TIGR04388 family protein [Leptospira sanjuanensis]